MTREPKATIEPRFWKEFLAEFSRRNHNRRARFDVFRMDGTVQEEELEAHLEDIVLRANGDSRDIQVIRIDRTEKDTGKKRDTIGNVIGVHVQYDTDGSEDAIEFTDDENTLISLRLESKVDGAS